MTCKPVNTENKLKSETTNSLFLPSVQLNWGDQDTWDRQVRQAKLGVRSHTQPAEAMDFSFPTPRPVSLPQEGGDTIQGESSALRRKSDPNRPRGIKQEMGLVPCQVANSNPALSKPAMPRPGRCKSV